MDFDESCSWKISQFAWPEMLDAISRDAHPPLYYALLKVVTKCFGNSVLVLRGLSILFGTATIIASGWFVRTAMSSEATAQSGTVAFDRDLATILSMALVSGNAMHVEMSQQARPYTLGTLLSLIAAILLLQAFRTDGRWISWFMFSVCAGALSFTHYYCIFTVAAFYCWAISCVFVDWLRHRSNQVVRQKLLGIILSLWILQLIWLPWISTFLFQQSRSTPQLWMNPLDWSSLSSICFQALAGGRTSAVPSDHVWVAIVLWAIVALCTALYRPEGRLASVCSVVPLAAVIAYSIAVRSIIGVKYLIFAQLFLLLSAAMLALKIPLRGIQAITVACLVTWSLYWCWIQAEERTVVAQSGGVRAAITYLNQHRDFPEIVVVASPFVHPIVQKYADNAKEVYTQNSGDHRENILSGPPLKTLEYSNIGRVINNQEERVWTIDSFGMFSPNMHFEVKLALEHWDLESQEEFREKNGIACVIAVRSFTRRTLEKLPTVDSDNPVADDRRKVSIKREVK